MDNKVISILEVLWLSKNEATIYTTLLRLGSSVVWTLSKETKIPRATAYQVLDKLIEQGLIMKIDRENILTYIPEDPDKILQNLKKEEERIWRKKLIFDSLLPELEKLQNNKKTIPKITYFEWISWYTELLKKSLETWEKVMYMMTNSKYIKNSINDEVKLEELIKFERREFTEQRLKRNILLKLITTEKDIWKWLKAKDPEELRETKIIPSDFGNVETMVLVWNHVILVTDNYPVVWIHIEEEQLTEMMMNFFSFLWKISK